MKIFSNIIIIIFGPENIGLWIAIQENFSNDKKKEPLICQLHQIMFCNMIYLLMKLFIKTINKKNFIETLNYVSENVFTV